MLRFVVEEYAPGAGGLEASARRARAAGAELSREGRPVRHERSILFVDDQVAFHVFSAETADAAAEAARRAAIGCDRVHRTVEVAGRGSDA